MEIFDRGMLRRRRIRFAGEADACDFLLRRAGEDIIERLETIVRDFPIVLNLGAYHGLLGQVLSASAKVGTVISMDDCLPLLKRCGGEKVLADPELLPFAPESVDLVVSALSLQFVNDLPGALLQIRQALKPDGLFLGVIPGGRTLYELREAFAVAEEELEGGVSPRVAPFVDIRDGGALLQRAGFALPVTDLDSVTVSYETPFHLMQDLQKMGASNVLYARRRTPLRRGTLMRMVEIYQERFAGPDGRIPATFELITLTGWCPHESQQKPLRPGSAQTRLADALGTIEQSAGEKAE